MLSQNELLEGVILVDFQYDIYFAEMSTWVSNNYSICAVVNYNICKVSNEAWLFKRILTYTAHRARITVIA